MGGSKKTEKVDQKTTQNVQLPAWMTGAAQDTFNQANAWNQTNPVIAYQGQFTAPMTANQRQASAAAASNAGAWKGDLDAGRALTWAGASGPAMYAQAPQVQAAGMTAAQQGTALAGTAPQMQGATQRVATGTAAQQGLAPQTEAAQQGWAGYTAPEAAIHQLGSAPMIAAMASQAQQAQAAMSQAYSAGAAPTVAAAQRGPAHTYQAMLQAGLPPEVAAAIVGTQEWDGAAAQRYMNPYLAQVQGRVVERMQRENAEQRATLNDGITGAKAFGGTRQAMLESELMGQQNRNATDYLHQSTAAAYDDAQEMFTSDQGRRLQADVANQGAKLQADTINASFVDAMLGRNMAAENDARRFAADANNIRDAQNAGWAQEANLANQSWQGQFRLADQEALNRNSLANADRLTDVSRLNAQLGTDVGIRNADRALTASQSNQDATVRYGLANLDAANQTSRFNAGLGAEAARFGADAYNTAMGANADRAQRTGEFNASMLDQMLGRNWQAEQEMRRANMDAANRGYESDANREQDARRANQDMQGRFMLSDQAALNTAMGANADRSQDAARFNADALNTVGAHNADRSLAASQTNAQVRQSMLDRLLAGGAQFADIGRTTSNLGTADIDALLRTGTLEQAVNQAELDARYNDWLRTQNAPLDRYKDLMSILAGAPRDVTTTGTTVGTNTIKEGGGFLNNMLGIAQIGASIWGGPAGIAASVLGGKK